MSRRRLPCAILAGGLATRLYPLTRDVPKALLDVAGEPFIRHQLRLLAQNGITCVVVCAGHFGDVIRDELDRAQEPGMDVKVAFDGPSLLGTAGALRAALPLLGAAFFVMYGDSYLPCNFGHVEDAFEQSQRMALMTVFRNEGRWDNSNVEFEGNQIVAYDKRSPTSRMQHIDYGLGVLTRSALERPPQENPSDLTSVYQNLLAEGQLAGYEVTERFYEIGSFEGLQETRHFLASGQALSPKSA